MRSVMRRFLMIWSHAWIPGVLVVAIVSSVLALTTPASAAQTVPYKVNYQGRLTNSAGTALASGSYNMKFRLYSVASGGTASWTETRDISTQQVTVTSGGQFAVQLGDVTALSPSMFTSQPLYLEVELPTPATATCSTAGCASWTEGAMTPRQSLASSPYAMNADTIDGIDGSSLARLDTANTFTGNMLFQNAGSVANAFTIQNAGGSTLFNIDTSANSVSLGQLTPPGSINTGNTSIGASTDSGENAGMSFSKFTTGAAGGTTSQVSVYISSALDASPNNKFKVAIYQSGGTYPLALLASSAEGTLAAGWNTLAVSTPLSPSTDYWIGFITNAVTATNNNMAYNASGTSYYKANTYSSGFPSTIFGGGTAGTKNFSMYMSVTTSGTTPLTVISGGNVGIGTASPSTTLEVDGTVLFKNATDSNTAFQIQNAGGSKMLVVDTTNLRMQVGDATADGTGVVLILDTKNTAGDPIGANGAMYYNSSINKFRCYQAAAWTDCIGTAGGSSTLQQAYDASTSPAQITTTAGKGVQIVAGAAPTVNILTVDNSANPTATNNTNGLAVNYAGGTGAIEGGGIRVDVAPGGTSGSTWDGVRIVANATGAVSGVTENGIKLEGPTTPGAGQETAIAIGTGWDLGLDIQSGGIQLAAQSDPSAPAAGNLRIYSKDIAGRIMPKWIGPAGVNTPFQASLGFNRVSMVMPAGGTTLTSFVGGFGTAFTNTGTAANPTPASTNLLTSVRRATFSTGTTAGTVASHRQSVQQVWRGNAAGMGGFFYTIRFGTSALQTGNRAFVGLADTVTAPTNVDPTTSTAGGKIGLAINANTGTWNFITNISGAAPTVTALSASFPVNTTDLYELVLYSPPNGSSIGYRVTDLSTGAQASGSASTNIIASTTFVAPQFWITNNTTAAAAVLDFAGWYLESDN